MFIAAFIGQKGGTGKTTASLCLGVAAAKGGQAVVVIDLDPQANAASWKDRRVQPCRVQPCRVRTAHLNESRTLQKVRGAHPTGLMPPGRRRR